MVEDKHHAAAVGINSSASFSVNGNMGIRNVASHSSFELAKMMSAWVDNKSCREYKKELNILSGPDFKVAALQHGTNDVFSLPIDDDVSMEMGSHGLRSSKTKERIPPSPQLCLNKAPDDLFSPKPLKRCINDSVEPLFKFQRFVGTEWFVTSILIQFRKKQDDVVISVPKRLASVQWRDRRIRSNQNIDFEPFLQRK